MNSHHDSSRRVLPQLRKDVLEACKTGDLGHVKKGLATPDFFPPLRIPDKADYHTSAFISGSSSAQFLLYKMIEIACKAGQANILRHLTVAFPIKPLSEGSLWAVLGAISSGCPETLKVLCEADPHLVHLNFSHYGSPLSQAIYKYDKSKAAPMVEVLLQAGASLVDDPKAHGTRCPVRAAISYAFPDVFEVLMRYGGDQYLQGITPLIIAAENDNKAMVLYLIKSGEDVNEVEKVPSHRSALWAAAENGHDQVVLFLLHHGADVSVRCSEGQLAVDIARVNGHSKVVEVLEKWGGGSKVVVDKDTGLLRLQ